MITAVGTNIYVKNCMRFKAFEQQVLKYTLKATLK